ncbi:hypothetical protein pEaSNUABM40_00180 [Erwinia phage pEa_SNUABM_40]|uniref:Uncharacterized protein n=1 Tax=Erwinia phage pEa_SNUABM_3 TaxID=2869552 RepID=A0AAE7XJX0_9CAUD|nr:hypothetical protein MPK68_gp177 [Erwinia phage pEa_SNUABM_3]QZE56713.1 hypothetical protein pEaSNUABM20_00177 [Erwinia phage pEa_SNUABM_20]QZE58396.1 hypothetical protein pEaSNUABM40_00180 [Erwinia phage pEa_SNUABM_40]UAW52958.1 hypothetical protein pEaSNUABM23_00176 [Erwinia phage pEa_SNUABM_23]UIW10854.1 hypothetical protein pEaSNUABM23_00176 [Erwinia phage pEa_SNUABM_31]QZE56374.1 hypothetical protein pEaSNUABM3_00177 [Erwinia phage pEa_SNUABM_3]
MLNKFYQKLQVIMTLLGLYDGQCDGVWGPKCIEAKRKWEMMDEFEPATPSNGLPFNGRGKLPKGMNYAFKGLDILWDQWDQEKADAILKEKGALLTTDKVHEHAVGEVAKAREAAAAEPVATVNTVAQAPIAASVLNTNQAPEPAADEVEDEDEEEEISEENTSPETVEQPKPQNNWTKKR